MRQRHDTPRLKRWSLGRNIPRATLHAPATRRADAQNSEDALRAIDTRRRAQRQFRTRAQTSEIAPCASAILARCGGTRRPMPALPRALKIFTYQISSNLALVRDRLWEPDNYLTTTVQETIEPSLNPRPLPSYHYATLFTTSDHHHAVLSSDTSRRPSIRSINHTPHYNKTITPINSKTTSTEKP